MTPEQKTALAELEKSRGYVMGAADRIREKLGLPIPSYEQRIAWINENIAREERLKKFAVPDYVGERKMGFEPKLKEKDKKC